MIHGAHVIIYSKDSDRDREFLREVLGLPHVDVGHGWLIFGLPPAEVAVHPSQKNDAHELYLMCEDVEAFRATLARRGIECERVQNQGWGLLTHFTLPGGGRLGVYQPRHARPEPMVPAKTTKRASSQKAPPTAAAKQKTPKKSPSPTKARSKSSPAKPKGSKTSRSR